MRLFLHILLNTILCISLFRCQQEKETAEWWTSDDRAFIASELDRTTQLLMVEIKDLNQSQWDFRVDSSTWSIGEIIEHLEIQNQLHFREISVTSNGPHLPELRSITKGQDGYFSSYATDPKKSSAKWFLEPLGRFRTKDEGLFAFNRARDNLTSFVKETPIDLRKKFTFRADVASTPIDSLKIGQVRDLHQLLLTGIAHTDRHIRQIREIKKSPVYPVK